jgi:hypothetical protein
VKVKHEEYCSRPSYNVLFFYDPFQGHTISSAFVCANDLVLNDDEEEFADLCVTTIPCTENDEKICVCSAEYDNVDCSSCSPCDDGRGVQVECGEWSSDCVRVEFPTGFNKRSRVQDAFIPILTSVLT